MELERVLIKLMADATQYNRTMDQVQGRVKEMVNQMSQGTDAAFSGMSRSMEKSIQSIMNSTNKLNRQQLAASKEFANRQYEDLQQFYRRRAEAAQALETRMRRLGITGPQANLHRDLLMDQWNAQFRNLMARQQVAAERFIRQRDAKLAEAGVVNAQKFGMASRVVDRVRGAVGLGRQAEAPDYTPFSNFFSFVSDGIRGLTRRAMNLVATLGGIGLGLGLLALPIIAAKFAAQYERAAIAFEVMTGNAQTGKKLLDEITALAIETPFTSIELIEAAKQVKAFGFETAETIPIISRLGDISQGTGARLDRLILAFGQVRTTGRLMGQELRQFTNAGVPILEYLSKVMKVPTSAVPQLVRQGRVSFEDVARAINKMTNEGGLFADMMGRINRETVYGRWQNFEESLQLTGRNLALAAFEAFHLRDVLGDLGEMIRGVREKEALDFFAGLKFAFMAIYKVITSAAEAVWSFAKRYRETVTIIVTSLLLVKGAFVLWGLLASLFTVVLPAAFAAILTPIGIVTAAVAGLILALNELGAFEGVGNLFGRAFGGMEGQFKTAWGGIINAVKGGDLELAFEIGLKAIEVAWYRFCNLIQATWVRVTANLGLTIKEAIKYALTDLLYTFGVIGIEATALARRVVPGGRDNATFKREEYAKFNAQYQNARDKVAAEIAADRLAKEPDIQKRIDAIMRQVPMHNPGADIPKLAQEAQMRQYFHKGTTLGSLFDALKPAFAGEKGIDEAAMSLLNVPGGQGLGAVGGFAPVQSKYQELYVDTVQNAIKVMNAVKVGEEVTEGMVKNLNDSVKALEAFSQVTEGTASKLRKDINIWPVISPEAQRAAAELTKEFVEGTTPLEKFAIAIGHVREAAEGPLMRAPGLAAVMGFAPTFYTGGLFGKSEEDFGMFKEFTKLQKGVGNREDRLPAAVFAGSREAADLINRDSQRAHSVQEQISRTLTESKVLHESEVEYMKQVAEELKRRGVNSTSLLNLRIGG